MLLFQNHRQSMRWLRLLVILPFLPVRRLLMAFHFQMTVQQVLERHCLKNRLLLVHCAGRLPLDLMGDDDGVSAWALPLSLAVYCRHCQTPMFQQTPMLQALLIEPLPAGLCQQFLVLLEQLACWKLVLSRLPELTRRLFVPVALHCGENDGSDGDEVLVCFRSRCLQMPVGRFSGCPSQSCLRWHLRWMTVLLFLLTGFLSRLL